MRTLAIVLVLLSPSLASADVPGPYDQHCTLELQQRDGSHCEDCSMSVHQRAAGEPDPCAALEARGLVRRCGRGATIQYAVYCDRAADFVTVAGGTRTDGGAPASCACRAGSSRAGAPLALLAMLGLGVALRRRR